MRVLQISSAGMNFFKDQVRILERYGIDCDVACYTKGSLSSNKHSENGDLKSKVLNEIYGHNPIYYAYRGGTFYPQILKTTLADDYDLVHVNSGMAAPLGLAQSQRPIVLTLWGDDLLGDRLYGYQPTITRFCARMSDHVIVRSEEMRSALPCDADIIPSGVDLEKFRQVDRETATEEVGWASDVRHVLFPYPRNQAKKRHELAESVVTKANHQFDDEVRLQTISGVDHNDMFLYYNAADALLITSRREGSPNTVKEAMACNLPIVTTAVGDVRIRLDSVANSHVCDTETKLVDALVDVIRNSERSDGRSHVEDVSLNRMGQRLIDIYESLIDGSGQPAPIAE